MAYIYDINGDDHFTDCGGDEPLDAVQQREVDRAEADNDRWVAESERLEAGYHDLMVAEARERRAHWVAEQRAALDAAEAQQVVGEWRSGCGTWELAEAQEREAVERLLDAANREYYDEHGGGK